MTLFQYICLPILAIVVASDFYGLLRRRGNVTIRIVRMLSWMIAAVLIANPTITSDVSNVLGIGRGTDLVVYVFMLAAPVVWFQIQARIYTLQRHLVELARIEAIRGAKFGESTEDFAPGGGTTDEV